MKLVRTDDGDWIEGAGYNKKPILNADDLEQSGTPDCVNLDWTRKPI